MVSIIPPGTKTVLEPTKGAGNLVGHLSGYHVTAPDDFFQMPKQRFDCVVMNPPFSGRTSFGHPAGLKNGMQIGYHFLTECMEMSDNVIALMPWFVLINSNKRVKQIKDFGLKSVTCLPRGAFRNTRIQTCVLEIEKGFIGVTEFKIYGK
jgi:type I restriction-modification system DNA methylase subunit